MIAQVLASREIDPSSGFVQLPIARLSEAVIVARTIMVKGISRQWIELMSELERYHDLALAQAPRRRRRLASSEPRSISPNPARSDVRGKFFALQPLEIAQNREGISKSPRRAGTPLDLAEAGRPRVRREILRLATR
jgi:hypothetical protein